ncbi:MAG: 1-acyl-sn-glycerol-3-phosphate acyltransferase [Clostridia bacterium]|nr:1-acyl-sn-glycerol-3-phosphate acyltransferase [Clostridia bacterium]
MRKDSLEENDTCGEYSRVYLYICSVIAKITCLTAFFYFKIFCHGKIVNEEIIRRNMEKGFVLISNHVSYMDWLVLRGYFLYCHQIKMIFLAKNKLFHHRIWKYTVIGSRGVRISDTGTKIYSHKEYKRYLEEKYVGVFPEGTRSFTGEINNTHGGIIKIAAKKNVPIIPINLEGFYNVLPRDKKIPRPYPCRIIVGNECRFDYENVRRKSEAELGKCVAEMLTSLEYTDIRELNTLKS